MPQTWSIVVPSRQLPVRLEVIELPFAALEALHLHALPSTMDLTTHPGKRHFPADSSLFAGGGQLGELMQAYDWHQHPLGPARQWPKSVQVASRETVVSFLFISAWVATYCTCVRTQGKTILP